MSTTSHEAGAAVADPPPRRSDRHSPGRRGEDPPHRPDRNGRAERDPPRGPGPRVPERHGTLGLGERARCSTSSGCSTGPARARWRSTGRIVGALSDRELAAKRNHEIGFVFQTFHLIQDLNVLDNVEIPLLYRAAFRPGSARGMAQEALERVGLSARDHALPVPALGRPAAACRHRAGDRRPAAASCSPTSPPGTSTARWATRSSPSSRTSNRGRNHDRHGDPRPAAGLADSPHRAAVRRPPGRVRRAC